MSSVGTPPPLAYLNTGHFFTNAPVDGSNRTVLRFPQSSGLRLQPTMIVFPSNEYSMVLLFRFDSMSGWRRIVDWKDGASSGQFLYVYETQLYSPYTGFSPVCLTENTWHQLVLTRRANQQMEVYCDGVRRMAFADSNDYGVISGTKVLRFFKDEAPSQDPAGSVARIRLYATALSSNEVVALDRLPGPAQRPVFVGGGGTWAGGQFQFSLLTEAGRLYQVQASSNLVHWVTITNVVGTGGTIPAMDLSAGSHAMRFYRAVVADGP